MTVEKIEAARGNNRPAVYLVKDNGKIVGMLEKYRNTRTETHPWKAILGWGADCRFLGAFYDQGDFITLATSHYDGRVTGGRAAAMQAIKDASLAVSGKVPAGANFDVP